MKLNDETELKNVLGKTVFFQSHYSQFFIKYFICLTVRYCYYYLKMSKTNNYFHLQIPEHSICDKTH